MTVRGMWRVAAVLATGLVGCTGGEAEDADPSAAGPPVVMESPRVRVEVGTDTVDVWSPTLFSYFGAGPSGGEPSPTSLDPARDLQETLADAQAGLSAMGVRVLPVTDLPVALRVPPAVEREAGPPLVEGGMGFLLVNPKGPIRRLERGVGGNALVCAAARFFELPVPAGQGYDCGA